MMTRILSLLALGLCSAPWVAHAAAVTASQAQDAGPDSGQTLRFAVLGHVRGTAAGGLYYQLDELLADVSAAEPAFAILTGDIIWGDVQTNPADSARVVAEWEAIDQALGVLGIPIYRVPGNHDINDLVTRDIYFSRYGDPQRVFDVDGNRFVFLSSTWIPEDGDTRKGRFVRGRDLDSAQVAFLRENLPGDDSYDRAFVFMHHLLWWQDQDGPWWRDVQPVLAAGKVAAVFSGDYGPAKYSYLERDGVKYFQSGVAPDPELGILRGHEWNRVLAQQFDNWLLVTVDDSAARYDVETIGATRSDGHWTPDRWRAVYGTTRRPPLPGAAEHLDALVGTREGRFAVIGSLAAAFLLGLSAAVAWQLRGDSD